jgi:hypothetical protein
MSIVLTFSAEGFSPSIIHRKLAASPSVASGCDQRQPLPGAVEVGRHHWNLRDQPLGLATLGIHGVVVGDGVVAAERTDAGAEGVHRRAVLGQLRRSAR